MAAWEEESSDVAELAPRHGVRVKIKDVVIKGDRFSGLRCSAKFDEVPYIAEGASIGVRPGRFLSNCLVNCSVGVHQPKVE